MKLDGKWYYTAANNRSAGILARENADWKVRAPSLAAAALPSSAATTTPAPVATIFEEKKVMEGKEGKAEAKAKP
ncbi:MAG: hypothetical protein LBI02_02105, partial [Opitutaceae bacterium]|nr:hypothetical protein [Opitutaceae bacterium]